MNSAQRVHLTLEAGEADTGQRQGNGDVNGKPKDKFWGVNREVQCRRSAAWPQTG